MTAAAGLIPVQPTPTGLIRTVQERLDAPQFEDLQTRTGAMRRHEPGNKLAGVLSNRGRPGRKPVNQLR